MCVATGGTEFSATVGLIHRSAAAIAAGEATAVTYLERALCYQQVESLEAAVTDYNTALSFDPPLEPRYLAQAYDSRSQCLRRLGQYEAAVVDGETAVSLKPHVARYRANLGYAYHWVGRFTDALGQYQEALALDPGDWWTCVHSGKTHLLLGQLPEAIAAFNAVENDKATPLLHWWRSQAYLLVKAYAQAEAECSLGLSQPPQDAQSWANLWLARAWARYGQGHWEAALSDFLESVRQKPVASAYLGWGLTYRALGLEQGATEALTRFMACYKGSEALGLYQMAMAFDRETAVQMAATVSLNQLQPEGVEMETAVVATPVLSLN